MDLSYARAGGSFPAWARMLRRRWVADLPPLGRARGMSRGESVALDFPTGARAEGRFVRPAGPGPHPAVLVLHEHGGEFDTGWEKVFDHPSSSTSRKRLYEGLAPAQALVEAGFAVLCVDALGFGRRQAGGREGQQALAANTLGLGWSLAGLVAAEDASAAAWLAAQPGIDAARVGVFGFSFGGLRAWQVAALAPEVACCVSLSWMACRADLMDSGSPLLAGHAAFFMLHPGLAARADFPDLAGLAAPKPLFLRSGLGDRHMPVASVRQAWDRIATILAAAGGPAPDMALHRAGHTCPRSEVMAAVDFLERHLSS